jgi:hypothetical protein
MEPSPVHEASRSIHWSTTILTVLATTLSCVVGSSLVVVPSFLIRQVFGHDGIIFPSTLELTLARLAGGLFLSVSFTSLLLLVAAIYAISPLNNCQVALGSHAMLGLTLILVGLISDRSTPPDDMVQYEYILGCGAIFLLISCIGLMASFWPVVAGGRIRPLPQDPGFSWFCLRRRDDVRQGLVEPLLNDTHSNPMNQRYLVTEAKHSNLTNQNSEQTTTVREFKELGVSSSLLRRKWVTYTWDVPSCWYVFPFPSQYHILSVLL